MQSLLVSINATATIFIPMLLGYALRKLKVLPHFFSDAVNGLIYKICLGVLLFNTIYQSDFSAELPIPTIIYVCVTLTLLVAALLIIMRRTEKDSSVCGVVIQGIFRGNASLYGIPIAISIYGNKDLAALSLIIIVGVLMFNVLSVFVFKLCNDQKPGICDIIKSVVTNPLVIFIFAGLLTKVLNIELPEAIASSVSSLSAMTTPLSFIAIGASFSFVSLKQYRKSVLIMVLGKLILVPLLFLPPAILFLHCRGPLLIGLVGVYASPVAVGSFAMAKELGGNGDLAALSVITTSFFSILTVFAVIFTLNSLALI